MPIGVLSSYDSRTELLVRKGKQKDDIKQIINYIFLLLTDYFSLLQNNRLISLD